MPVIGTAGHVDHGKSTLVRALTGMDPDRLAEEKRRGLTIDLGFAWFTTPEGREVGIVDVPGHERFIKNMLAGAGAVNRNLFVVAANEGWMPQSQEHLDILDLLDVSAAIVVLTKIDTVDPNRVASVRRTVAERIAGTALAGAPVLEVSAVTGQGVGELVAAVDALLDATPDPPDRGRARLWIDRVFTIKGSGTVVTGTLGGGFLEVDQTVEILPGSTRARIRSIQSHRHRWTRIGPGSRTALNLVGADPRELARGHSLGPVGAWRATDRILVSLGFLPHLDHEPQSRGAYKLHVGSVEVDVTLRFLQDPPTTGEPGWAALRLARPVAVDYGDRFILRDAGRRRTVGGGMILEPHPTRFGGEAARSAAQARAGASGRHGYLMVVLEETGYLPAGEVMVRTGVSGEELDRLPVLRLPTFVVAPAAFDRFGHRILEHARAHQRSHPLEAGLPLTALRSALPVDPRFVDELVAELDRRGVLVADGSAVHTPEFRPEIRSPAGDRLLAELREAGASPPTVARLGDSYGAELVRALVRSGDLVQVSPDFVYPAEHVAQVCRAVQELVAASGPFTVAQFRDLVGTSRKFAVPFLEYLDRCGITVRQGDLRRLGPKAGSGPGGA